MFSCLSHGPLARYVKLCIAGNAGNVFTFSPTPTSKWSRGAKWRQSLPWMLPRNCRFYPSLRGVLRWESTHMGIVDLWSMMSSDFDLDGLFWWKTGWVYLYPLSRFIDHVTVEICLSAGLVTELRHWIMAPQESRYNASPCWHGAVYDRPWRISLWMTL